MPNVEDTLALTDENKRLVNLFLFEKIKAFGIQGVFDRLEASFKVNNQKSTIDYEAMKKALQRDLKDLNNLSNNAEKLRHWFITRKKSSKLQIRILDNNFLLNCILSILGINYSELFNKDNLPGQAEEPTLSDDLPNTDYDDFQYKLDIKNINAKLDLIIEKYSGYQIRKTYMLRYNNFIDYLLFFKIGFIPSCHDPEINGFSKKILNGSEVQREDKEIYGYNIYIIYYYLNNMIRENAKVSSLFSKFVDLSINDLKTKRMLCPFFMIGILVELLHMFIVAGIKSKKSIFKIIKGNIFDIFSSGTEDNKIILEKVRNTRDKTFNLIEHLLDHEINPNDEICIKSEILFLKFLENVFNLFSLAFPSFKQIKNIIINTDEIKNIEKKIKELATPGINISFIVKQEQLGYLDECTNQIEEIQNELDEYYVGKADVPGKPEEGKIYITSP